MNEKSFDAIYYFSDQISFSMAGIFVLLFKMSKKTDILSSDGKNDMKKTTV